ncbi:MAG: glycosyltransferase [Anaerolineae bacterium]|nr:glycosyltransferase [Anaerolineae bacterium]
MRVLIWSPLINLGGGKRLLERLAPAIAEHPDIEQVGVAAPVGSVKPTVFNGKLTLHPLTNAQASGWLAKDTWQAATNPIRAVRAQIRHTAFRLLHSGLMDRLEDGFDIVYAFWPHTVPFYRFSRPLVCTFQDTTLLEYPEILGGPATQLEWDRSRHWLNGCARTVVSSANTARCLEALFGLSAEQFPVIPHNILLDATVEPAPPPSDLPGRYLLYPANINAHKNHEILLTAFSRIQKKYDTALVLVGEGLEALSLSHRLQDNRYWRQDRLMGLARRLGLVPGRDLFAPGYVTDAQLKGLVGQAQALVMPSLSEGGGSYPVEEAMIAGIPVLCSDIPVMREHVGSRQVIWFDPYSVDSLVTAVETLFDHYDHYRDLAEQNRTAVRPTWDQIGASYVDVFREVLSDKR